MHDAFMAAVEQWPRDGLPDNPRAWLVSTGRFKALTPCGGGRVTTQLDPSVVSGFLTAGALAKAVSRTSGGHPDQEDDGGVDDDRLRLIFTCCHPALTLDAQIALTMREVCGLKTEEIARAFLVNPPTVAQKDDRSQVIPMHSNSSVDGEVVEDSVRGRFGGLRASCQRRALR